MILSLTVTLIVTHIPVFTRKLLLDLSNLGAAPDLIVEETKDRERETNCEDNDVDGKATAVFGLVVGSEDLGTVNTYVKSYYQVPA